MNNRLAILGGAAAIGLCLLLSLMTGCANLDGGAGAMADPGPSGLKVGWAQGSITPTETVLVAGQFHARVSEGVADPVTTTALVLESADDHLVLVSCDLVGIPNELRDAVRERLKGRAAGLDPAKVVLNATHTHTAPVVRVATPVPGTASDRTSVELETGMSLPVMQIDRYRQFAAERIAEAIVRAWDARSPGGVAYGAGTAVVGRNRRWVDTAGKAMMYGKTDVPEFSHIEGYEDHSVGFLATYDPRGKLTGLMVNVPCPSQVSEHEFVLSADYWCETRQELRTRFGKDLFILPQCSAAGDQSPHLLYDKGSAKRMLSLKGRTQRQEIARRIADAAGETVPFLSGTVDRQPCLRHRAETVDLPMNALTEDDVRTALAGAEKCRLEYEREKAKLEADANLRRQPRWYLSVTEAARKREWYLGVAARFESQKTQPNMPVELHVVRLGDVALVTVPFEYYLDFGVFIKARSPATQTFLVQLAGGGSYCPSARSLVGGGYGSLPASNPVGPAGGRKLAERAVDVVQQLWKE